jgi:hypothetical protein
MNNDARRGQAPHLPRLRALDVETGPARLIEPDERETLRDGVRKVPERLRRDDQSVAPENPALTLERDVVEVLVDQHLDRKRQRVPPAGDGPIGTERGLDHLGLVELTGHLAQLSAAARTGSVGRIEGELALDHRQPRLLGRARRGQHRRALHRTAVVGVPRSARLRPTRSGFLIQVPVPGSLFLRIGNREPEPEWRTSPPSAADQPAFSP